MGVRGMCVCVSFERRCIHICLICLRDPYSSDVYLRYPVTAATSPGSPQRPGARSSPGKRGALGLAAATDTLSCFQCEVNLRPMAPGLTRRIKVSATL